LPGITAAQTQAKALYLLHQEESKEEEEEEGKRSTPLNTFLKEVLPKKNSLPPLPGRARLNQA